MFVPDARTKPHVSPAAGYPEIASAIVSKGPKPLLIAYRAQGDRSWLCFIQSPQPSEGLHLQIGAGAGRTMSEAQNILGQFRSEHCSNLAFRSPRSR